MQVLSRCAQVLRRQHGIIATRGRANLGLRRSIERGMRFASLLHCHPAKRAIVQGVLRLLRVSIGIESYVGDRLSKPRRRPYPANHPFARRKSIEKSPVGCETRNSMLSEKW